MFLLNVTVKIIFLKKVIIINNFFTTQCSVAGNSSKLSSCIFLRNYQLITFVGGNAAEIMNNFVSL